MYGGGRDYAQVIGDCSARQGQKMVSDPMELGLPVLVSHNTFVLGSETWVPLKS